MLRMADARVRGPHQAPPWARRLCRVVLAGALLYGVGKAHAAHGELQALREAQALQTVTMRLPAFQSSWDADPGITVRVSTYLDDAPRGRDAAAVHQERVQALLATGMRPVPD